MSYCRWSSMDWRCDLYLYYSVGDFWSVNVASRKHKLPLHWPTTPPWPEEDLTEEARKEWFDKYLEVHNWQMSYFEEHDSDDDFVELTGKYAGFYVGIADKDQLIELLEDMKRHGVIFPYDIIDDIREEPDPSEEHIEGSG